MTGNHGKKRKSKVKKQKKQNTQKSKVDVPLASSKSTNTTVKNEQKLLQPKQPEQRPQLRAPPMEHITQNFAPKIQEPVIYKGPSRIVIPPVVQNVSKTYQPETKTYQNSEI
jgi:hypothetical protein